jgi:hypothetical protein
MLATRLFPAEWKPTKHVIQGVDWVHVKQLIDCSTQLRRLVAPHGTEGLYLDEDSEDEDIATGEREEESEHENARYAYHMAVRRPSCR